MCPLRSFHLQKNKRLLSKAEKTSKASGQNYTARHEQIITVVGGSADKLSKEFGEQRNSLTNNKFSTLNNFEGGLLWNAFFPKEVRQITLHAQPQRADSY